MKKKENSDISDNVLVLEQALNAPVAKPSNKEKRLDQRRQIEELLEEKRLRKYTEEYDYYFDDNDD